MRPGWQAGLAVTSGSILACPRRVPSSHVPVGLLPSRDLFYLFIYLFVLFYFFLVLGLNPGCSATGLRPRSFYFLFGDKITGVATVASSSWALKQPF